MQTNIITYNIIDRIYSIINKQPANIAYLDNGSLFDRIVIGSLPHNVFVYKKIEDIDFNRVSYDLFICSDPVAHSQNQHIFSSLQIPSVVMIHNSPISNIKKEDKFLLARYLQGVTKIFFDINIANAWSIGHDAIIDYGFPEINRNISEKTGSVIVLNAGNIRQISMLYNSIKNKYNDAKMLSYVNYNNVDDIIDEISKYKIAIAIENTYDSIVCGLAGCCTITTQRNKYLDLCIVPDFSGVDQIIQESLLKDSYESHNVFRSTQNMVLDLDRLFYKQRLSS